MCCLIKYMFHIQESEAFLSVEAEDSSHKNVRDKRTIGFLRQLFPNLSQVKFNTLYTIIQYKPTYNKLNNNHSLMRY